MNDWTYGLVAALWGSNFLKQTHSCAHAIIHELGKPVLPLMRMRERSTIMLSLRKWNPRFTSHLVSVGLIASIMALTPSVGMAFPFAGDYVFTGELSGTFTSDGTKLTTWSFSDRYSGINWDTASSNQSWSLNNTMRLSLICHYCGEPSLLWGFSIDWTAQPPQYEVIDTSLPVSGSVEYHLIQAVSEPTPLALLALGLSLLALVEYHGRQRRQAGLRS